VLLDMATKYGLLLLDMATNSSLSFKTEKKILDCTERHVLFATKLFFALIIDKSIWAHPDGMLIYRWLFSGFVINMQFSGYSLHRRKLIL